MTDIFHDKTQPAGKVEKPEFGEDSTNLIKESVTANHMPWPQGKFEHGVQSVRRPRFGFDV